MSSDIAVQVSNVSKYYQIYDKPIDRLKQSLHRGRKQFYREFKAIDDVSFDVRKGETIGIIGKNGSGKSTLLQMICGTLAPTSGEIQVNGRVAALLELGAGFNPEFTGQENVYLNATLLGLMPNEINERYDEILEFADIGDFIDQPVKTYSSGMYVRLAFAIQASIEPEILIVDEALAVGDAQFVHRCMLRFHELQSKGTTILFVSHDSSSIKRLCSRAIWLRNGCVSVIGDASDVVDAYLNDSFGLGNAEQMTMNKNEANTCFEKSDGNGERLAMPSNDGRYGERFLEIVGAQLSNAEGIIINSIGWNEVICLLLEIKNNNYPVGNLFDCGYIMRDNKGVEIASSSTAFESASIVAHGYDGLLRVLIKITVPMLHPGSYSLTPSLSSVESGKNIKIHDRIQNAFVFSVSTNQEIYTPYRFETNYSHSYL